jgi:hypothetical protein
VGLVDLCLESNAELEATDGLQMWADVVTLITASLRVAVQNLDFEVGGHGTQEGNQSERDCPVIV